MPTHAKTVPFATPPLSMYLCTVGSLRQEVGLASYKAKPSHINTLATHKYRYSFIHICRHIGENQQKIISRDTSTQ